MSTARVRRMEAAHTSRVPRFSSPHVPNALKGTTLARHNGRVENYVDSLVEAFKTHFNEVDSDFKRADRAEQMARRRARQQPVDDKSGFLQRHTERHEAERPLFGRRGSSSSTHQPSSSRGDHRGHDGDPGGWSSTYAERSAAAASESTAAASEARSSRRAAGRGDANEMDKRERERLADAAEMETEMRRWREELERKRREEEAKSRQMEREREQRAWERAEAEVRRRAAEETSQFRAQQQQKQQQRESRRAKGPPPTSKASGSDGDSDAGKAGRAGGATGSGTAGDHGGRAGWGGRGGSPPPAARTRASGEPMLGGIWQERRVQVLQREHAEWDRRWAALQARAAAANAPCVGLAHVPWIPAGAKGGVAWLAETDSAAQRKKKLHTAMLRWHPDKFLAAFGSVLLPAERDAVLDEVTATAARLFAEMEADRRQR